MGRVVLDHILESITAASGAQAAGARMRLGEGGAADDDETKNELAPMAQLAIRLAAARHSPRPALRDKSLVILCGDHGVAIAHDARGEANPTVVAVRHIASGQAAVNAVARGGGARLIIVDCGIRGAEHIDLGAGVIRFRVCDGTRDFTSEPAMTPVDTLMSVETGIALLFSLVDQELDVLALGHVGAGSHVAAAAIVSAMTGTHPRELAPDHEEALVAAANAHALNSARPLDLLARVGGPELGMMVGMILAAASVNIPVVLDDLGTGAAALIAHGLAPHIDGYLFASHGGTTPTHRHALRALGLTAHIDAGLSHGEGAGAGLALPTLEAAARLLDPEARTH